MQRYQFGIFSRGKEGADLFAVLFRQDGAGGVEQGTAALQLAPEGIENPALQLGQLANVLITAQPLDVGVTADNAGGGAGGIQQNAVELALRPPLFRGAGIAVDHFGGQADAIQVLLYPLEAVLVGINGDHASQFGLTLQQVGGLAAGGGAGIQHPLTRLRIEQGGGLLCCAILYRAVADLEAGQLGHVAGTFQQDAILTLFTGHGIDAGFGHAGQHLLAALALTVVADPHGGALVIRLHDELPLVGISLTQALGEPLGVTEAHARHAVDTQQNHFGAALEVAQHTVDKATQGGALEQLDRVDGLGHRGVSRNAGVDELVEADQNEVVEDAALVLERLVHHLADRCIEAGQPAQGTVAEFLQEGAIAGRNLLLGSRQNGG